MRDELHRGAHEVSDELQAPPHNRLAEDGVAGRLELPPDGRRRECGEVEARMRVERVRGVPLPDARIERLLYPCKRAVEIRREHGADKAAGGDTEEEGFVDCAVVDGGLDLNRG